MKNARMKTTAMALALAGMFAAFGTTARADPVFPERVKECRLVFVTSTSTPLNAERNDIAWYNNIVNTLAQAVPALAALTGPGGQPVTWTCIGSAEGNTAVTNPQTLPLCPAVDARTNTKTNPNVYGAGVPIYRWDGVRVADNYNDLWDGTIQNPISLQEDGTPRPGDAVYEDNPAEVWTGTKANGTKGDSKAPGGGWPMGANGGVNTGLFTSNAVGWVEQQNATGRANGTSCPFYAMSSIIAIVDIAIYRGATPIAVGGTDDFGTFAVNVTNTLVFDVTNPGLANLSLTDNPAVTLSGDTDQFTITTNIAGPASIAVGGSTNFAIAFSAASGGSYTSTVSIANNTAANNPYTFKITAKAQAPGEPPILSGVTPSNMAVNIWPGTNLTATFNQWIQRGTGYVTITNITDGTSTELDIAADFTRLTVSKSQLVIDPDPDLLAGKTYAVLIGANAIKNVADDYFAGISDTNTWAFTTDGTAPTKVSLSPADDATDVPPNANLVITFSEDVTTNAAGSITVTNVTHGGTVAATISVVGNTVTINPNSNLENFTSYAVLIDTNAIKDMSGNVFAGYTSPGDWNFTSAPTWQESPAGVFTLINSGPWNADNYPGADDSANFPNAPATSLTVTVTNDVTFGDSANQSLWRGGNLIGNVYYNMTVAINAGKTLTHDDTNGVSTWLIKANSGDNDGWAKLEGGGTLLNKDIVLMDRGTVSRQKYVQQSGGTTFHNAGTGTFQLHNESGSDDPAGWQLGATANTATEIFKNEGLILSTIGDGGTSTAASDGNWIGNWDDSGTNERGTFNNAGGTIRTVNVNLEIFPKTSLLGYVKLSHAINYAYRTPEYVMGAATFDPNLEYALGTLGRWSGVIFRDLSAISMDGYTGEKWSVQDKDVMIAQRALGHGYPGCAKVVFESGFKKVERDGWVFVDNGEAFAAVKVVTGGTFWGEPIKRSLYLEDQLSPIIIQTGMLEDYGSFEKFQESVLKAPLKVADNKVEYTGPNSAKLEFFPRTLEVHKAEAEKQRAYTEVFRKEAATARAELWKDMSAKAEAQPKTKEEAKTLVAEAKKAHWDEIVSKADEIAKKALEAQGIKEPDRGYILPKINGKTLDFDLKYNYRSPYMESKVGSDIVTVRYGQRRWDYDFGKNTITESKE